MRVSDRWPARVRHDARSPLLRDVALIVAAVGCLLVVLAADPTILGRGLGLADVVGAIVAVCLVVLGRRARLPSLAAAAVATAVTIAVTGQEAVVFAAAVMLQYKVASQTGRRTTWLICACTIGLIWAVSLPFLDGVNVDRDLDIAIWSVVAVAIGDAVRSRRSYVAAVEERARRAEESREEEARRRVAEERLRIARDLHDLVAHRMAVINVQAGVASHLLHAQPERAEQALLVVRESAAEVLGELGEMLSVLRNVDEPEAPVEPAPTLRDLGALVESFDAAGLKVSWRTSGRLDGLADSVQLALFRLAQEGLTNAQRYGDGRVSLSVVSSPLAVDMTIANRIGLQRGQPPRSGFGLLGMRERLSAIGGTVEVGSTEDGWFRVAAHVPLHESRLT